MALPLGVTQQCATAAELQLLSLSQLVHVTTAGSMLCCTSRVLLYQLGAVSSGHTCLAALPPWRYAVTLHRLFPVRAPLRCTPPGLWVGSTCSRGGRGFVLLPERRGCALSPTREGCAACCEGCAVVVPALLKGGALRLYHFAASGVACCAAIAGGVAMPGLRMVCEHGRIRGRWYTLHWWEHVPAVAKGRAVPLADSSSC